MPKTWGTRRMVASKKPAMGESGGVCSAGLRNGFAEAFPNYSRTVLTLINYYCRYLYTGRN